MRCQFHRILTLVLMIISIALVVSIAPPLQAQNVLGLYFDQAGTVDRVTTSAPYEFVTGFLILQNPSHTSGVDSWECVVEPVADGPDPLVSWSLSGQAINVATPPAFSVGLGTPLPSIGDVLLATATIVLPEAGREVAFYLLPQDPPSLREPPNFGYPVHAPLYGTGSGLVPLALAGGCASRPVAVVNDDGVDPVMDLYMVPLLNLGTPVVYRSRTTIIANNGERTLIGRLRIEGGGYSYLHSSSFVTTDETWFRIDPGMVLPVTINFNPTGLGDNPGRLVVETCGELREISLMTTLPFPVCEVETTVIDMGNTQPGYTVTRHFRISNVGDADLDLNITVDDWYFNLRHSGYQTIGPGDHLDNVVFFSSGQIGYHEGTITLGTSSDCDPIQVFGWVLDDTPGLEVNPRSLNFGSVLIGQQVADTLAFHNSAAEPMAVDFSLGTGCDGMSILQGGGPFTLNQFEYHDVVVAFAPADSEWTACDLLTGVPETTVRLLGEGLIPNPSCSVVPEVLDFGQVEVGHYPSHLVAVTNDGNTVISFTPSTDGPPFYVYPSGNIVIQPGGTTQVTASMGTSAIGDFEGTLHLGLETCPDVPLLGSVVPSTEHLDRVGIFFDEGFTQNVANQVPAGVHPAYLVLKNSSGTGGVTYWECCITVVGQNEILDWVPAGDHSVISGIPPCFSVGLNTPLPVSEAVLLMTMDVLVYGETSFSDFYLDPFNPSAIPGGMAYEDASVPGVPILMRTGTGSNWVAQINRPPVAVELPSPVVTAGDDEITLTWEYFGSEADGFHVWRRIADGASERLTREPLTGSRGSFRYTDRPQVFGHARLSYTCAATKDGVEIASGPEVAIDFAGRPAPLALTLRPNYPNPFNPTTTVPFELAQPGRVRLAVFDLAGRQIAVLADGEYNVGYHEEVWTGLGTNGRRAPSGAYYLRLESGGQVRMRQMMLLK